MVLVLSRRVRRATPAARRQLVPVLIGGTIALLFCSIGLVMAPLSSRSRPGRIRAWPARRTGAADPAFLGTLLQRRLSRGAVGELLLELRDPASAPDLEDALRRALGDASLRLGRLRSEERRYVDRFDAPLYRPQPGDVQVATPILYQGEPIGLLVHDRSLRLRPELLDAVSAAAGFALANERALETAQLVEQRNRALLDAIPDTMLRVARDGTYLDIRPDANTALLGSPAGGLHRRKRPRPAPGRARDTVIPRIESTLERRHGEGVSSTSWRSRGVLYREEARIVPSGPRRGRCDLPRLHRAAARRGGATAARGRAGGPAAGGDAGRRQCASREVFQTVTEEVCRLLGLRDRRP